MSRQGKHKEGMVSVGIYVEEEKRALIAYVADLSGMTATDLIMEGVLSKAVSLGVVKDGAIVKEHKPAIDLVMAAYRLKKQRRKTK